MYFIWQFFFIDINILQNIFFNDNYWLSAKSINSDSFVFEIVENTDRCEGVWNKYSYRLKKQSDNSYIIEKQLPENSVMRRFIKFSNKNIVKTIRVEGWPSTENVIKSCDVILAKSIQNIGASVNNGGFQEFKNESSQQFACTQYYTLTDILQHRQGMDYPSEYSLFKFNFITELNDYRIVDHVIFFGIVDPEGKGLFFAVLIHNRYVETGHRSGVFQLYETTYYPPCDMIECKPIFWAINNGILNIQQKQLFFEEVSWLNNFSGKHTQFPDHMLPFPLVVEYILIEKVKKT